MSELIQTLAAYVPLPVARAALEGMPPPTQAKVECFPGAVLFADISGFTPLTEALAERGAEGPEELTRLLNDYFQGMMALIEAQGGEVVKFSGDALTALFCRQGEGLDVATRRALQAAEAMQAAMSDTSAGGTTLETSIGPVELAMKIGIGAGEILTIHVGGISDRWEYVVAGDPVRQVTQAEEQAERGQIVLSPEAQAVVLPHPVSPSPLSLLDWSQARDPQAVEAVLRCYVPAVVVDWLGEGLQEWLAVLRPMTVMFVGVSGIDYTKDSQVAVASLHTFLRTAQETLGRYQGSINKLAVDDKGTILLALLGAPPYAHADDAERALRCALDLQAAAEAQEVRLAIGVTTGRVFAGPVGSATRHEYTVMGDTVNLAARLMKVAGPGQVCCDFETYRRARARLAFDLLPPTRIKGKAGLVRVYRPTGEAGKPRAGEGSGALVGRQSEVAQLIACLADVQAGQSCVLIIEGEAGIGKSRLVEELTRLMRERGLAGLWGAGRSVEQQTPYRAWRDIFVSYFGLEEVSDPDERRRRVQDDVRDVAPELSERIPLLNSILNLGGPDNELTASMDAQLRHESLVSLLLALLQAWAAEQPLVLVLEDAHWLDSLSWDLTLQAARTLTVARVPLFLVVVMRPLEGEIVRGDAQALGEIPAAKRLVLGAMSPQEAVSLAAARLGVTESDLPPAVADLVRTRSGGNPFFAEELVYALRDSGMIAVEGEGEQRQCAVQGNLSQAARTLPTTIQGIVLSRIDRLPPEEQLTLKVAAVIGRTFAYPALYDTLGEHLTITNRLLSAYLDDLVQLDLTPLEAPEPELTYIFKHIITQEVAYETLLYAQRRQLHRTVARWYERHVGDGQAAELTSASSVEPTIESSQAHYYPLLAYHWHQAQDTERERTYAGLAGRWAAAQFANAEAAGYLSRALELTPKDDVAARYDLLAAREGVNDLRGEREAQSQDLATLADLADQMGHAGRMAAVNLRWANYYEVTSDYPSALAAVERAIAHAAQTEELATDTAGHIAQGRILIRQGEYEGALASLERALAMARGSADQRGEAQSRYYLSDLYLYQGSYPQAQEHCQQALALCQAIGDRPAEANNLSNLGVIHGEQGDGPAAGDYFQQALRIYQAIGDRPGMTFTLNNLGVIYADMGDYATARDYHQQALEIRLAIGDRWGEANSQVNLGLIYHNLGQDEAARACCERALAIQREIGNRRGQGYSLTYLGHALAGLGELEAAAQAYKEAAQLRRQLGQHGLAIDDLAGLARVDLARGDLAAAQARADEIVAYIEAQGREGIEYPLEVELTCYRVLHKAGDEARAQALLEQAHAALMARAAAMGDPALRAKFLADVPAHRAIVEAWKGSRG